MRRGLSVTLFLWLTCAVFAQYSPTWDSLDKRPIPQWYDEAKFGLFIHWGVYSVPAWAPVGVYAEWYWHDLSTAGSQTQKFHNQVYGPNFNYQEFAPRFTAELFDAKQWMSIIKRAGVKYLVPTSKHHEGFTLWKSDQSWNWNAVDIGPKQDLLAALMNEARAEGITAGLYYSLYEWFHPLYVSPNPELYVEQVMIPQLKDLVTNYKPDLIFTDGEWEHDSSFWNSTNFLAWLFNSSPVKDSVVINDRWGSDTRTVHGGYYTPEYSDNFFLDHKWEENSGIDIHSFGYNRNTPSNKYWSTAALLQLLIRSVVYGGNLLLDIGPTADGRIPEIMQERLLSMGEWLDVNGEAIYKTVIWRTQFEYNIADKSEFTVEKSSNNIYGMVNPGQSSRFIKYQGKFSTATECENLCGKNDSCLSYVWADETVSSYSNMCYHRYDGMWTPVPDSPGLISGKKDFVAIGYTKSKYQSGVVYAVLLSFPPDILSLLSVVASSDMTQVELLGYGPLNFKIGASGGLIIQIPRLTVDALPCQHAWVLKLTNVK